MFVQLLRNLLESQGSGDLGIPRDQGNLRKSIYKVTYSVNIQNDLYMRKKGWFGSIKKLIKIVLYNHWTLYVLPYWFGYGKTSWANRFFTNYIVWDPCTEPQKLRHQTYSFDQCLLVEFSYPRSWMSHSTPKS